MSEHDITTPIIVFINYTINLLCAYMILVYVRCFQLLRGHQTDLSFQLGPNGLIVPNPKCFPTHLIKRILSDTKVSHIQAAIHFAFGHLFVTSRFVPQISSTHNSLRIIMTLCCSGNKVARNNHLGIIWVLTIVTHALSFGFKMFPFQNYCFVFTFLVEPV